MSDLIFLAHFRGDNDDARLAALAVAPAPAPAPYSLWSYTRGYIQAHTQERLPSPLFFPYPFPLLGCPRQTCGPRGVYLISHAHCRGALTFLPATYLLATGRQATQPPPGNPFTAATPLRCRAALKTSQLVEQNFAQKFHN